MKFEKNRVYLQNNFFCRSRALDLYRIRKYLLDNGYVIVEDPAVAEYLILSTCGTVEQSTIKSIKQVEDLQKYEGILIVIGCLPDTDKGELESIFKGISIRNVELNKLDEIFMRKVSYKDYETLQMEAENGELCIEICRGCVENCSYCAIRNAIGNIKSISINECKKYIDDALSKHINRIILGAENAGAYGIDLGITLSDLLYSVNLPPNSHILRINNFHPRFFVNNIDVIKSYVANKTIGLLKIPIQSGSQRILNLMRRTYDIDNVISCISNIRDMDNSIIFMTDIIIGFPGEELNDVYKTLEIVKNHFDIGRIFLFTPKTNTQAHMYNDNLSLLEKEKRLSIFVNELDKHGMIIGVNDDSIYTFSRKQEGFDLSNPYANDAIRLFNKNIR